MNERIQELKHQAQALAFEEHKANCLKTGRDPSMPHANALNMTFEKFAELIVRECAQVANENVGAFTPGCGNSVLDHFGVES